VWVGQIAIFEIYIFWDARRYGQYSETDSEGVMVCEIVLYKKPYSFLCLSKENACNIRGRHEEEKQHVVCPLIFMTSA
jgi:hypothetical protein